MREAAAEINLPQRNRINQTLGINKQTQSSTVPLFHYSNISDLEEKSEAPKVPEEPEASEAPLHLPNLVNARALSMGAETKEQTQ